QNRDTAWFRLDVVVAYRMFAAAKSRGKNRAGLPVILSRHAVVRGDELPGAGGVHPDISKAVAIFVRLALGGAFLVVAASDYGNIAVHADFDVAYFGHIYVHVGVADVRDVSSLAVNTAVFNGDDHVLVQQRVHAGDVFELVGVCPLVFQRQDFGRRGFRFFLGGKAGRKDGQQGCRHN